VTSVKGLDVKSIYSASSSWWEHVPVAHWLVANIKPSTIVELGTHYGVSFFAFCEAAQQYNLDTFVYAIDTWKGDTQAGLYGEEVYQKVKTHQTQYFRQRSEMIRSTFDNASEQFGECSIDMLHIDGLHSYDAVLNDYNKWNLKVKEGGTILFHDWNVHEEGFGVWKFWSELKLSGEYQCIEISNGYGLGIATKTKNIPTWHDELKKVLAILKVKGEVLANLQEEKEKVKKIESKNEILNKHAKNLETIIEKKENIIRQQETYINEKTKSKIYQLAKRIGHKIKWIINLSNTKRTN